MKTKRLTALVAVTFIGAVSYVGRADGAVVINLSETGGNVVAATSGGVLNIDALTFFAQGFSGGAYNGGLMGSATIRVGSGLWNLFVGGTPHYLDFANVSYLEPDIESGLPIGMGEDRGFVFLPSSFTSGSLLAPSSSTWYSVTLGDFGLTAGSSFTTSWGSGPTFDSITLYVAPEPSVVCLIGFGWAAFVLRRHREG